MSQQPNDRIFQKNKPTAKINNIIKKNKTKIKSTILFTNINCKYGC